MQILIAYVLIALVGVLIAVGIGALVERFSSNLSLLVFLAMFFAVLFLAWPLAVRVTSRWDTGA